MESLDACARQEGEAGDRSFSWQAENDSLFVFSRQGNAPDSWGQMTSESPFLLTPHCLDSETQFVFR
jgi:hypothetical protein